MADLTVKAVQAQVTAMGCPRFEVGLFKPATEEGGAWREMLPRVWDREEIAKSISWMKFENREGRNIYIRPQGEHALTLIDDLSAAVLRRMEDSGFIPAVIVETSPGNFQAWLNHGKSLPRVASSAAARALADRFGGDRGAADWRHFGRLAGFTNRKPKYRGEDGRFPFVRLIRAGGEIYPQAEKFLHEVEAGLESARQQAEDRRRLVRAYASSTSLKTIEEFRRDARYGRDGNRIDLAYAIYALSHGVVEDEVRAAITSRPLDHKGNERRQAAYVERTIQKALQSFRESGRDR